MKKLSTLFVLQFLFLSLSIGQQHIDDPNYGFFNFYQIQGHTGMHLYTGSEMKEALSKGYYSYNFKVGLQTTGKKEWQQIYRYPHFGLGFFTGYLGPKDKLGVPSAVYGFLDIPFYTKNKFHLEYEIGFGLSYDFKKYDSKDNPTNDAIGSKHNVYIGFQVNTAYRFNTRWELNGGIDFTHFSNGRTNLPNLGLNLAGANVGLRYYFNPIKNYTKNRWKDYSPAIQPKHIQNELSEIETRWIHQVFLAAGTCELKDYSQRFYTSTLNYNALYHYSRKYQTGIGINYWYDGSLQKAQEQYSSGWKSYSMLGLSLVHEWHVHKFAMIINLGTYLYNPDSGRGLLYSRLGLKYKWNKHLYSQISLKTMNGAKADFIEWGMGLEI